jgi:hypothetical protein
MKTDLFLKAHAAVSTVAIVGLIAMGATGPRQEQTFDRITVRHIDVVDSRDRVRVQIAGEFSPRRKQLSGLLFHNEDGHEAGGLVYSGRRDENGDIQAGAILTFDQYREDQIMAIQYAHSGDVKRTGMLITDRPDELGEHMAEFYRAFSEAETDEERQKLREEMLPTIPPEELPARRLYLGRTTRNSSTINLYDPLGRVRLKLEVDSLGVPRIEFLDEEGTSIKKISIEDVLLD